MYHYGALSSPPGGGALRSSGSFIVMEYLDLRGRFDQGGCSCVHMCMFFCLFFSLVCAVRLSYRITASSLILPWARQRGTPASPRYMPHRSTAPRLVPCPAAAELGRQMARMHLATPQHDHAGMFGFTCDNTIGGSPQPNPWENEWVRFFREHRLRHQLTLAGNSRLNQLAEPLLRPCALETFFEGLEVRPSVLHGECCLLLGWLCV